MTRTNALRCTASLLALTIATATASAALAQNATDATPAGAADENVVESVVVTGSRVATGATAPTPVTAVTPDAINKVAQPNIADALIQLPALRSGTTSASRGGQGGSVGSNLSLRSLGALRTLVLVNGQRFVPTMQFGLSTGSQAVNVESIPQGLIKRTDIVTGGASAAYGSDAVSGVVNFILDEDFKGLKAEVQGGQTSRGDGVNYSAELTAGGGFNEDRGHILANFSYARDLGIQNDIFGIDVARPFQDDANTVGLETINGQRMLVHGARLWQYPLNGLVLGCLRGGTISGGVVTGATAQNTTNCPIYGVSFNDTGTATKAYDFGIRNGAASIFSVGGDGWRPGAQSVIDTPSMRHSMYGRVSYDLTPKLNVYMDVLTHWTKAKTEAGAGTPQFVDSTRRLGFEIARDNPFIPADLLLQMQTNNISALNLSKTFYFNVQQTYEAKTDRFSVGGNYQFNDNWTGDFYYTHGVIHSTFTLGNFSNDIHLYNALHAVTAPSNDATGRWKAGDIVCASTLAGVADGCIPWNPFGTQIMTKAQNDYINPTDYYFSVNSQDVAEATVNGSLFKLPAGAVDVAFGAGYRKETVDRTTDALGLSSLPNPFNPKVTGALIYLNNPAIHGSIHMSEVFGEAQVPLLKDLPFAQTLEANFAARYTDYSLSGGVTTWKAGLAWVPFDGVRVRTAYSRDVRAANLVELFSPPSSGFANVTDPANGGVTVTFAPQTVGNPTLDPEQANTLTFGVVLRPTFWPSVYSSIDYWQIKMEDQIAARGAQTIVNECELQKVQASCALITRNSSNQIVSILLPTANLASTDLRGVDLELGYNHAVEWFNAPGAVSLRAFATYVIENSSISVPGAAPVDTAPQLGRLQGMLTGDYKTGPWTVGAQVHYLGGGRRSVTQLPRYLGDNYPDMNWTDIFVRHDFGQYEVFGTVQNVFDQDPPYAVFTGPNSGFGTSNLYDVQGRRYKVGVRVRL